MTRLTTALLSAVLLLASSAAAQTPPDTAMMTLSRPDAPPLAARGPLSVGVKTVQLSDPARNRTVTAEVWYPSSTPDAPIRYAGQIGPVNVQIKGRALRDGVPSSGKFPLIVASHGQPGTRYQFAYLAERLAARGFVVATLDHPGSTYATLTQPNYISSLVDRPLDLLLALNEIPRQFAGADGQNAALLGYSYGGYSALNAAGVGLDKAALEGYCTASNNEGPCFALSFFDGLTAARGVGKISADPRIKAVFVMAPYGQPWLGKTSLAGLKVPLFVAAGEADDVATYKRDALEVFRTAGSQNRYLLSLAAAQHNPWVECPEEARSSAQDFERCSEPVWDLERAHDITVHFASAFFGRFLKNDAQAATFLDAALPGFGARSRVGVRLEVGRPE